MSLTIKDLEKLQAQAPDYRMELVNGSITVRVHPVTSRMKRLLE
jgi:hypothetical protein